MSEQKALFFDIDGTIWNEKNVIPDSCREAFRQLHKRGHLTFICSGRARGYIQNEDLLSPNRKACRKVDICGRFTDSAFLVEYSYCFSQCCFLLRF